MKYFNKFNSIKEYYQDSDVTEPVADTESTEPVEGATTEEPATDTTIEKTKFSEKFSDSFGYNKTKINEDAYATNLESVKADLDAFITENKQEDDSNPIIKDVKITAQGSASWVNTKFGDSDEYKYENNVPLATKRGEVLSERVKTDISLHLESKGYTIDSIKFDNENLRGIVQNKASKEILNNFIKDNYENDKIGLSREIADKAGSKKSEVKFFKDDNDEIKTRPEYADDDKHYENLTLEDQNAEKIYELLANSPAYVTYTSKLKKGDNEIRVEYRKVQTASVAVEINANVPEPEIEPDKVEPQIEQEPEAEQQEQPEAAKLNISLKSIPFAKDSSSLQSKTEYAALLEIVKDYKKNNVIAVSLVGHAEADDELVDAKGKPVLKFNANSDATLTNKSNGAKVIYTERMLADLRFILAWERIKVVVAQLNTDAPEFVKWAIENNKLYPYSLGSEKADTLSNPRIVQVMVQTKDEVLDSEQSLSLFSNGIKGNSANTQSVQLAKTLKYNLKKFYNTYLAGDKLYTAKFNPTYIAMAKPKSKQEALKYYNFRGNF